MSHINSKELKNILQEAKKTMLQTATYLCARAYGWHELYDVELNHDDPHAVDCRCIEPATVEL